MTDHKPLMSILGPKKGLPTLAAARIQRWAILLLGYQYDLEFRTSEQHNNADGLSRLPEMSSIANRRPRVLRIPLGCTIKNDGLSQGGTVPPTVYLIMY